MVIFLYTLDQLLISPEKRHGEILLASNMLNAEITDQSVAPSKVVEFDKHPDYFRGCSLRPGVYNYAYEGYNIRFSVFQPDNNAPWRFTWNSNIGVECPDYISETEATEATPTVWERIGVES